MMEQTVARERAPRPDLTNSGIRSMRGSSPTTHGLPFLRTELRSRSANVGMSQSHCATHARGSGYNGRRGETKTKTFYRTLLSAAVVSGLAGAASAAEVSGILMDKLCSATALKGGQDAAVKHARTCNLTPNCSKSGWGVYTADGKYIALDAAWQCHGAEGSAILH